FILRPVATSLLMAAILLAGAVAYVQLPVSALPQVDYPTIQVLTFYPGASPDVVASAITAPLERQFGQVPGLKQMTSTSSAGSSVEFGGGAKPRGGQRGRQGANNRPPHVLAACPPHPADLQQGQSCRCADSHPRPDLKDAAPGEGAGPC